MHVQDDLYTGNVTLGSFLATSQENPTAQIGVGPIGRMVALNIVPLTVQTNNIATSQHMTNGTGLTLTAGTGITSGTAPDGSGSTVLVMDTPRAVSLTSTANLSAINFTITGFDQYGQKMTQTIAGPNNNTVNTSKAFNSVLSIVPNTTDGTHNVTAGTADIFGLPWLCAKPEYVMSLKWNGQITQDGGVFTPGDTTSPATASTGDVRGTYAPSSASNGTKRLTLIFHMDGTQLGVNATRANAVGVTQA